MGNVKESHHVQKELEQSGNELYSEYMGFEKDVYSFWHCDLYTITVIQNGHGNILALSYETDDVPVQEL